MVKGLEINDINFRGEFSFSINSETELLWKGTKIRNSDLKEGQNISITSIGNVLESYPAQLTDVEKIIILDDEIKKEDLNKKEFIKTYNILNIAESNDEKYLYLTIRQFQFDEVETVKVLKSLADIVEINKNYEFTFESSNIEIKDNIKSIFNNATLISIKETDKTGLEQIQETN